MKKGLLGISLLLSAFSFAIPDQAAGCILCAYSGGSGPECELVPGETGGSSCYINCGTSPLGFKCFCRTLGNCGGSNQCDGQPCPVANRKQFEFFAPESRKASVFLTREQIAILEAADPEAASLLTTFAKDNDALLIGLKDAIPLVPGEYDGMVTEAPIVDGKATGPAKVYRYEASVLQDEDGVIVRVEIFEHPSMRRLYARIQNGAADNLLEVTSLAGHIKRIEM